MSNGSESSVSSFEDCLERRYIFLRKIGSGTFSSAWAALDKVTRTKVVLKTVHKKNTSRSLFKKELKYSRMLSGHRHVINTRSDAFETDKAYVLIQDLAAGGDLFDAIGPEIGLAEETAKRYIVQVASALHSMHTKGLVHRDVKPENIVLEDKNGSNVLLIDFGMTRRTGYYIERVCGSIPYTPPEVCMAADGYHCHTSSDVWSVGVLLYCMLTGNFPWEQATECDSNFAEFCRWQRGESEKIPPLWRQFSPKLLELFSKLLCLDWQKRCSVTEIFHYTKFFWFQHPTDKRQIQLSASSVEALRSLVQQDQEQHKLQHPTNKELYATCYIPHKGRSAVMPVSAC
ncbi:serine/threonine-protein kinase SBK1-like [Corticium candelabrum]|uniref:serine/threonine-protein kinase SBK1-like n=1 Tax=Corticium candelabrum TaxID=121492 RepID=UPI002E35F3DE|nr:serine/threonine-protein kinase SBK1-like [Corticium candelabrum]